jgi:hypothetical protein
MMGIGQTRLLARRRLASGLAVFLAVALGAPAIAAASPPSNDAFANATVIGSLPFNTSEDMTQATGSADDPLFSSQCNSSNAFSVWFSYTPTTNQRVGIDVSASSYPPPDVRVVTGSPGAFDLVTCSGLAGTSVVRFDALANTTYHVEVTDPGMGGTLAMSMAVAPAGPANDSFANATPISGYNFTDAVNTTTAIQSVDDPLVCGNWNGYATVWYSWAAPADATATIDTNGSDYATALEVFTGQPGDFTSVACGYKIYGEQPSLTFAAHAGTTYSIMVGSTSPDFGGGNAVLNLAARRPAGLSLSASSSWIPFGHGVALTAHLPGWHTNSTVSIYRTPDGGTKTLLASGSVDANGNLKVLAKPSKDTTYTASYAGDDQYKSASANRVVRVRVLVSVRQFGYYATSGAYRLYHYHSGCPSRGLGCPTFVGTVTPNHAGHTLRFVLQRYNGGWKSVTGAGFRLNSKSQATAVYVYGSTAVEGIRFRVRCVFGSDTDHLGNVSKWVYFRVTP